MAVWKSATAPSPLSTTAWAMSLARLTKSGDLATKSVSQLQLHECGHVAVAREGDRAFRVLAVGALGRLAEAALAQPQRRRFGVAVRSLRGRACVHHSGAGELAQRLYVFRGNCHGSSFLRVRGELGV